MIATTKELEQVRRNCRALVRRRARAAGALAALPLPGIEFAADLLLLRDVIPAINRRFGLAPEQIDNLDTPAKIVMHRLLQRLGVRFAGKVVTVEMIVSAVSSFGASLATEALAKYVPVVGAVAARVIAYEVFKRIADKHIDECTRIAREMLTARAAR